MSVESADVQLFEDLTVSSADSSLCIGSADSFKDSADEKFTATPATIVVDQVQMFVKYLVFCGYRK